MTLALHLIVETPTGDSYVNPLPAALVERATSSGERQAGGEGFDLNHEDACK